MVEKKKKKKKIQNMLTYLLILFYTLTCYFHREKCFEFEGNVYDLFFICKGIISEMDKKKSPTFIWTVYFFFVLQWFA
jgi:hypothetical protein